MAIRRSRSIGSSWQVPDAAAELLLARRAEFASLFNIDAGLDLLAAQTQTQRSRPLPYRDYMTLPLGSGTPMTIAEMVQSPNRTD